MIHENYFPQANDSVITLAMIETVEAVGNLDAILDTPHLTGVYVGPGDLAVSMGKPPGLDHTDPEMDAAIGGILEKVKAKGLKCGIHCLTPDYMAGGHPAWLRFHKFLERCPHFHPGRRVRCEGVPRSGRW